MVIDGQLLRKGLVSALVILRKSWKSRAALLVACVLAVLGLAVTHNGVAHVASSPPVTNLGIWNSAEDSGSYSTVSGQSPDVANYYLDWAVRILSPSSVPLSPPGLPHSLRSSRGSARRGAIRAQAAVRP
jgi:hypothetical protein